MEITQKHEEWMLLKQELPNMIANWNKLYYCHRHDIVFIPGDSRGGVPPEKMLSLL
jgi:hypothetical protein